MEQVAMLNRDETVRMDCGRLMELCDRLGEAEAESLMCRAMEELAVRLSFAERQYRQGKLDELRQSALSLVSVSDRIGMDSLSRVAADAIECVDTGDDIATAAVVARLIRIGERSLSTVWEMHD